METSDSIIKGIRRAAAVCLWGTLLILAATITEHYLAENVWRHVITTNEYTHNLLMTIGLVVAVVDIAAVIFTTRRQLPKLRQLDDIGEKLVRYRSLVRSMFYVTLVVALIVSAVIIIINDNVLIMLLLLLFVTLVLNYPNMYKIKADLGLVDEEMQQLFGDQYIK